MSWSVFSSIIALWYVFSISSHYRSYHYYISIMKYPTIIYLTIMFPLCIYIYIHDFGILWHIPIYTYIIYHYISYITIIYLDLRKDTNNCPFARFLPLGRISCEGAGNGHFLTTVVNFGFRTFWADLTLLCVKMCRFFWAEIPGKRADIPGKREEIPGQIHHDSKNENMKW